jgi:lysine 2,3-aminomutase
VKIVRFHTRVPAVDPAAITGEMVEALKASGKAVYVALHANHARELTPAARAACARIVDAGVPMISQTVLLAGINDDPETLGALMRAFVETRIKPYYLHHRRPRARHQPPAHQPRRGPGADEGAARRRLGPGPADLHPRHPRRPRQGPGRPGLSGRRRTVEDPQGANHPYPPSARSAASATDPRCVAAKPWRVRGFSC